jgi:hypothetical protein
MASTAGVKSLVEDVLRTFSSTNSPDLIDHVFQAIEGNPQWSQRYQALRQQLGALVVNSWGAQYVAKHVGKTGQRQVPAKSSLIESYSILA